MAACNELLKCDSSLKKIYAVPIRQKKKKEAEVLLFDRLEWPWEAHYCPVFNAMFPGISDISPKNLSEACSRLNLPKPYRLVIVVCVKETPGPGLLKLSSTSECV